MDLDATDVAIVTELQHDGRITNAELAERVGLSPSACLRRVRSLEQSGVITRYAAVLDPVAIGRGTSVFVEITLTSQAEPELTAFEAAIVARPEVMRCHLMAGEADYLVQLACADVADYERLHRILANLPGVSRLRSSFAIRRICDRTAYDLGPTERSSR